MSTQGGDARAGQSTADLRVTDVTVRYGAITAVDDVSIRVAAGQIVCVLGPNGAGKSTLLGTIAGVHRPASGSVILGGRALPSGAPEKVVRRGVSLVPEGRSIFGALSVEDNLRLGGSRVSGADLTEGLERAFARFPVLGDRRRQAAGTLSGGEQQQLAIARSLMSQPDVVLYDEPSLGLAPMITRQIFDLIQELRDEGMTSLLVEQNVHAALGIADYAYVLVSGRIVREGPAAELAGEDLTHLYLGEEVGA